MISYLGSADGYNSESPERLHINFAKAAYRASNKHDYLEQMAIWLQRQEAIWLRDSYLMWVNQNLPELLKNAGVDETIVDEQEVEEVGDDQAATAVTVTLHDIPTGPIWQVAKTPPYQNMSPEQLSTLFGAEDFISQLSVYLGSHSPFPPNLNDRFNAYRQVKIILPPNRYLSNQTRTNRIRTTPAVPRRGRRPATLGHFDVALVIVDRNKYQDGNGFDGQIFFY